MLSGPSGRRRRAGVHGRAQAAALAGPADGGDVADAMTAVASTP
jgi:hypothetical protein